MEERLTNQACAETGAEQYMAKLYALSEMQRAARQSALQEPLSPIETLKDVLSLLDEGCTLDGIETACRTIRAHIGE